MAKRKRSPEKRSMGRRQLLRGLGTAALALPFMRSFVAHGQLRATPKLLVFATPNAFLVGPRGTADYPGWLPTALHTGTGYAEAPASNPLTGILAPLEPHRSKLVMIDGLHGVSSVGSHQQTAAMLTGTGVYGDEAPRASGGDGEWYANGESVDQLIARTIGSRVLGLAFHIDGFQLGEGYISHLGPNRGFTPIQNPVDAFDRVFGAATGDPAAAARIARQRSVLDSIAHDIGSLQRRLPAADRARLDAHLDSVHALEADLVAPASCDGGAIAPGTYDYRSSANLPRLMRDYSRIMVQSLVCGYTRVGFLQTGNLGGGYRPSWPEFGISTTYSDHAIAHKFVGEAGAGSDGLSQAAAIPLGLNVQKAYNTLFAELIEQLSTTMDTDGSPMIDNTIVLHVKQMGENHNKERLFWIMAGGANLGIRTGRFIRLPSTSPYRYVNDLHVALCHAMGVTDVDQFGLSTMNHGPLDLS